MALNSSGPISLAGTTAGQSIEIENGGNGTTQISLNDTAVRTLAGVTTPASTIIMPTNFYGKANEFPFTISSNTNKGNLATLATAAGWNGSSKVVATINAGVYVYSDTTATAALTVSGSFPGGASLINNGTIVAMGGAGQRGGPQYTAGGAGGTALSVSTALSVTNNGTIAGGGGGGGGGGVGYDFCGYAYPGGGGGGGRTGLTNSAAGEGGTTGSQGGAGSAGTLSSIGYGGGGSFGIGGDGGNGGDWGAASGYAGGSCTSGAATYITWVATGTRYGAIN
jgi:hypothetical protein